MPQDKKRLRNLPQFKKYTDEEFERYWETYKSQPSPEAGSRVEVIMNDLAKNYDLRDMFVNDTLALREYARIQIMLDDLHVMEMKALEDGEINKLGALSRTRKEYLDNQSKIASDLNIKRSARQTDSETLETYLPSILKKAKNFMSQRLSYIYCPKCQMLVANAWFNNWKLNNSMTFTCPREECSNIFTTTSEHLHEHGNKNIDKVLTV